MINIENCIPIGSDESTSGRYKTVLCIRNEQTGEWEEICHINDADILPDDNTTHPLV